MYANLPMKPSFNVDSHVQPAVLLLHVQWTCPRNAPEDRRKRQSEVEANCLLLFRENNRADRITMVTKYQTHFDPEVGLIIVLRRLRTRKFGEITQNKGHYAVHGHSRSPILALTLDRSY